MWRDLSQKTSLWGTLIACVSGMWLTTNHLSILTRSTSFHVGTVLNHRFHVFFSALRHQLVQVYSKQRPGSLYRSLNLRGPICHLGLRFRFLRKCQTRAILFITWIFTLSSHSLHLNVPEGLAWKATCTFPRPFSISALIQNFDSIMAGNPSIQRS